MPDQVGWKTNNVGWKSMFSTTESGNPTMCNDYVEWKLDHARWKTNYVGWKSTFSATESGNPTMCNDYVGWELDHARWKTNHVLWKSTFPTTESGNPTMCNDYVGREPDHVGGNPTMWSAKPCARPRQTETGSCGKNVYFLDHVRRPCARQCRVETRPRARLSRMEVQP